MLGRHDKILIVYDKKAHARIKLSPGFCHCITMEQCPMAFARLYTVLPLWRVLARVVFVERLEVSITETRKRVKVTRCQWLTHNCRAFESRFLSRSGEEFWGLEKSWSAAVRPDVNQENRLKSAVNLRLETRSLFLDQFLLNWS